MYSNGLIHRVDIYPIERNTSNRVSRSQMKADVATMEDIACRIVKDEKIMFHPDIILKVGDVIRDTSTNKEYMVEDEYIANNFKIHHRTYKVKRKAI